MSKNKEIQETKDVMVQIERNNDEDLVRPTQIDGKWYYVPTKKPVKVPLFIAEKLVECNYISDYTPID